ncbi:hypothetical protein RB195_015332 [Necator americanus]|uniref:Reverse transcriptase domain-containing protein n=1 Tax=Necator americanus TaxID=51031 RepID=A0ABR1E469_NECAM
MESLATNIYLLTLNCRSLSSELHIALYIDCDFCMHRLLHCRKHASGIALLISIDNYVIFCGDADEGKVGGCAIVVRSDYRRRKLRRQLQQDGDNEWTSSAKEFEKAWEDKNPREAYALLKQYSGKMKRCSPVPNITNGVAVDEAALPIWRDHCKTLLNRQTPSASELEHVHRPTYAVNEEPPTESEVLVCIQKMKDRKSGGDDGISAEMLKYLPPSGIREGDRNLAAVFQANAISFLDFEAAFDSPHRGLLLNALLADGVPGKFVRLLDDKNQGTTAAVRTAECAMPFEVVTGVRQGAVAGPFLFPTSLSLASCEEQSIVSWRHSLSTIRVPLDRS